MTITPAARSVPIPLEHKGMGQGAAGPVLLAALPVEARDRLSARLRGAGFSVLSGSGRESCRVLASSAAPSCIIAPLGAVGADAREWISGLVDDATPWIMLDPDEDGVEAVQRALGITVQGFAVRPTNDMGTHVDTGPHDAVLDRFEPRGGTSLMPPRETGTELALDPPTRPIPSQNLPVHRAADSGGALGPVAETEAEAAARLDRKLADIREGDYFAVLDVSAGATPYMVRQHYQHLKSTFRAASWPVRLSPAALAELDEVGRGLRDAYAILGDSELRARYERALTQAAARGR